MNPLTGDIVLHVISVSIIIVATNCRVYDGGYLDACMNINQHIFFVASNYVHEW